MQDAEVPRKVVSLVSTRPRVSRFEFYVALALLALAQEGQGRVCFSENWNGISKAHMKLQISALKESSPMHSKISCQYLL